MYQNFDGDTLEEDIMKHYTDDLQSMLLALIKGLYEYAKRLVMNDIEQCCNILIAVYRKACHHMLWDANYSFTTCSTFCARFAIVKHVKKNEITTPNI